MPLQRGTTLGPYRVTAKIGYIYGLGLYRRTYLRSRQGATSAA